VAESKQELAEILERVTGLPVQDFSSYDFGRKQNFQCVSVIVPAMQTEELLAAVRAELPEGCVAFIGINWGFCWMTARTEKRDGFELVIGPGTSQFDIIKLARPDEIYGSNDFNIQKMQQYDADFGIDIVHASEDTIEFRMLGQPSDLDAFVRDLNEYCPFEGDTSQSHDLSHFLRKPGVIFLWWD
jgi:hypothetical protein